MATRQQGDESVPPASATATRSFRRRILSKVTVDRVNSSGPVDPGSRKSLDAQDRFARVIAKSSIPPDRPSFWLSLAFGTSRQNLGDTRLQSENRPSPQPEAPSRVVSATSRAGSASQRSSRRSNSLFPRLRRRRSERDAGSIPITSELHSSLSSTASDRQINTFRGPWRSKCDHIRQDIAVQDLDPLAPDNDTPAHADPKCPDASLIRASASLIRPSLARGHPWGQSINWKARASVESGQAVGHTIDLVSEWSTGDESAVNLAMRLYDANLLNSKNVEAVSKETLMEKRVSHTSIPNQLKSRFSDTTRSSSDLTPQAAKVQGLLEFPLESRFPPNTPRASLDLSLFDRSKPTEESQSCHSHKSSTEQPMQHPTPSRKKPKAAQLVRTTLETNKNGRPILMRWTTSDSESVDAVLSSAKGTPGLPSPPFTRVGGTSRRSVEIDHVPTPARVVFEQSAKPLKKKQQAQIRKRDHDSSHSHPQVDRFHHFRQLDEHAQSTGNGAQCPELASRIRAWIERTEHEQSLEPGWIEEELISSLNLDPFTEANHQRLAFAGQGWPPGDDGTTSTGRV